MDIQVGDKVKVSQKALRAFERSVIEGSEFVMYTGTVVFVSDSWATILVNSRTTGLPMFRQMFWKEDISKCK